MRTRQTALANLWVDSSGGGGATFRGEARVPSHTVLLSPSCEFRTFWSMFSSSWSKIANQKPTLWVCQATIPHYPLVKTVQARFRLDRLLGKNVAIGSHICEANRNSLHPKASQYPGNSNSTCALLAAHNPVQNPPVMTSD